MKKRTLLIAAWMGSCALQGMAQQIVPDDVAGEKEYGRVCREYELKGSDSVGLLQAYLDAYPDSRHRNRVVSLIASAYFAEKNTKRRLPCISRVIWKLCPTRKGMNVPCVWLLLT